MYKVYCWINRVNGKRYVGMTKQTMNKRAGSHMHGYEKTPYFWNAIQKYGEENFECRILAAGLTLQEAEQKERNYIRRYRTRNPQYGYNIEKGGTHNQTDAVCEKQRISSAKSRNTSPKAIAYRKTLRERLQKNIQDPAYRAAMSAGLRRMWQDPEIRAHRLSKLKQMWQDPEMRARILAKRNATGRQAGASKPVRLYCKETDTTYDMIADAERELGFSFRSTMYRAIKRGDNTFIAGARLGTPYTITRLTD